MLDNELISVIIPNYNKDKYIKKCVESVIKQTYRPIEIVIVDDCSSDSSRDIIINLASEYTCIKPIFQSCNGGVSFARNTGALEATGKYITFLDSDDYYYNNEKLSNEMKVLLSASPRLLSYSKLIYVDEKGKCIERPKIKSGKILEGKCADRIIRNCPFEVLPRDYCIDKNDFIEAGMYNVNSAFYEDLDLLIRLAISLDIKCTGENGTAYRQVINGLSSKSKSEQLRGRWGVSYQCFKNLKQCRSIRNAIYLAIWKVKIELKIFLNNLFENTY